MMDANPPAEDDNDEMLVAELYRLGVRHLVRLKPQMVYPAWPAPKLIASLAGHGHARFRGALLLLFLRRPSLNGAALEALPGLDELAANTLRLYYQAATYLRPAMEALLRAHSDDVAPLPALSSAELGLPAPGEVPVEAELKALGERHAQLTDRAYNWAGSYRQHLPLFLKQLQRSSHANIA